MLKRMGGGRQALTVCLLRVTVDSSLLMLLSMDRYSCCRLVFMLGCLSSYESAFVANTCAG